VTHGVFVRSDRPLEQIVEVIRQLDLADSWCRSVAACAAAASSPRCPSTARRESRSPGVDDDLDPITLHTSTMRPMRTVGECPLREESVIPVAVGFTPL
jgi:hypothetical protein